MNTQFYQDMSTVLSKVQHQQVKYHSCKDEMKLIYIKRNVMIHCVTVFTAPVVQAFQTNDEYPLMNYQNGRPRGHSLNANQAVRLQVVFSYLYTALVYLKIF